MPKTVHSFPLPHSPRGKELGNMPMFRYWIGPIIAILAFGCAATIGLGPKSKWALQTSQPRISASSLCIYFFPETNCIDIFIEPLFLAILMGGSVVGISSLLDQYIKQDFGYYFNPQVMLLFEANESNWLNVSVNIEGNYYIVLNYEM